MGSKKTLPSFALISAGVMTGTNTIASTSTDISNLDNIGLQVSWTGSAVGTLSVQCSNDNSRFDALTFSPILAQPNGTASGYLVNLKQLPWKWLKVSYTNISSTGLLTVTIFGKDLN